MANLEESIDKEGIIIGGSHFDPETRKYRLARNENLDDKTYSKKMQSGKVALGSAIAGVGLLAEEYFRQNPQLMEMAYGAVQKVMHILPYIK